MSEIYARWSEEDCVRVFAEKRVDGFYESETRFLKSILSNVRSVLDVGCASGRFIDLLKSFGIDPDYVGIDIGAENVGNARRLYPGYEFFQANALDFEPPSTFDLVNATGVCQHEPSFEELIRRMLSWSERFVLFDVKFAAIDDHLVDLSASYTGSEKNRLYYILLNYRKFRQFLVSLSGVGRVAIYGYETPVSARAVVPASVGPVVSAGIMLDREGGGGGRASVVEEILPASMSQHR